MSRRHRAAFVAFLLLLLGAGPVSNAASIAPVAAEHGMVVSAQHLASEVGVDVLKKGGNAVDAAVAVGYALAVVYPGAGNIGGGGFMTIRFADGRRTFLDFREKAPLAATPTMYLDADGNPVPGASLYGYRSVAVPGSVAGFEYALAKYGSQHRATLMAPAIALAEDGFILDSGDVDLLRYASADFRRDPASAAIFLKEGQPFAVGDRLVQKDLAETLERISVEGAKGFYEGATAQAIVAASRDNRGILNMADFEQYTAREFAPLECDYRGYHIISAPPPSSGGAVICEILNILEGYPLKAMGFHSAAATHVEIEAMRQAFADRNTYLGDPAFVTNPLSQLLDKNYAAKIRSGIDAAHARRSADVRAGIVANEGANTTHYSIVDKDGNAVAVTYTLNRFFGARITVPGTGILLNDEMDDFAVKAGAANMDGLVQFDANTIAPGKRPLSSMSPTIVTRDDKLVMVLGTPGGSHIPTVVVETLINVLDYRMDVQEAIDAPRFHQQWQPEQTGAEPYAFSADTLAILTSMGHTFGPTVGGNQVAAILLGAPALDAAPVAGNRLYGAIDPRGHSGLALGY